jgi:SAM-dependent methyltransferase
VTTATAFDRDRAKAFLNQMVAVMNGGAMALMCSLGHRAGLFDVMANLPPSTPEEIAAAAGLHPRPVREWLNAVTVGGIVDHDHDAGTYHLPAEHAGLLTRAAGTLNLANGLQFIGQMGKVEDEVVESFRTGAGVPYTSYDSFHRLMAEVSAQRFDNGLLQNVVPLVPGLEDALRSGIEMADVGCGSGHAVCILGEAFPNSRFAGYDISAEAIDRGRAEAAALGLRNVEFHVVDAAKMGEADRFEFVTSFDAIHDQPRPAPVFAAIFAALKSGGRYLCVEPNASTHVHDNHDRTHAPFLYAVSTMHCMQVSLAAPEGEGVGAAWGREEIQRRLSAAGFADIELARAPHDRTNDYWLSTKP